jgi:hypothetical protein
MRSARRFLCAVMVTAATMAWPVRALASANPSVVVRGNFGSGGGAYGYAGRFGVEGELWLVDAVGLGLLGARLGQTPKLTGDDMGAWVLAPTIALRQPTRAGYFLFGLAAGVGQQTINHRAGCGEAICESSTRSNAFYGGAMLGFMFQPTSFEVGPLLRAEATGETWQFTAGVAIGFAL